MKNELFEFKINNNNITITKYIGRQADVAIPSEIDGKPVTKIGDNAFRECCFLTYVDIPEGITEIGACAFSGCSSLKSVMLPNSLKKLGDRAFGRSLKSVSILKRLDVGNNFHNLKVVALCKCGQMFMFDPNSKDIPVCPRCGISNQFKIATSSLSFLICLLFFLSTFFGSISLAAAGLKDDFSVKCYIVLVLSAFVSLVADGFNQLSYLSFKLTTNPKIPKRERPCTTIKTEESAVAATSTNAVNSSSPVETGFSISDSSSVSKDNSFENSMRATRTLDSFLTHLKESQEPSHWEPLSPYYHSNVLGLVISADENGFRCNRITPNFIPWEYILHFSFDMNPVMFLGATIQTSLKVIVVFKDRHSCTFTVRFNSDVEAIQCQKTLEEYLRRAKILAAQSSPTATDDNINIKNWKNPHSDEEIQQKNDKRLSKEKLYNTLYFTIGALLFVATLVYLTYGEELKSFISNLYI